MAAGPLQNSNIKPKRLKEFMDNIYGDEWYEWQDDALRDTLARDGHGNINPIVWNILRAIQALRSSQYPYQDYHVFEKTVLALNKSNPNWEFIERCDPEEIAYAITCIKEMFPSAEFSKDVPKYIAVIAASDGFVVLPPPLDFAQMELDKIMKKTVADGATNAVLREIEDMKKRKKVPDMDSLPAQAAQKYLAVLAYVDEMRK